MSVPMTVERQGDSECMLATIAAVSMRPLAEVRAIACKHAGVRKWSRASGHKFWDAVDYTARQIGGDALAALVAPGRDKSLAGASNVELPAVGRGIVRFGMKRKPGERTEKAGHICAWQDGMLYDSAGDNPARPWPLPVYLLQYPHFYLKGIRTIAYEGNPEVNPTPTPDLGY